MEQEMRCNTCFWYDGDFEDEVEFCEEREGFVMGTNWCYRWKSKNSTAKDEVQNER